MNFRRAFRLSRPAFRSLVHLGRHKVQKDGERATPSSGVSISPEICVAIGLRLLASASYIDLMIVFGLAKSSTYECFSRTTSALLLDLLPMDGFPETEPVREEISMGFIVSCVRNRPLHVCVGDLDGLANKVKNPRECSDPAKYSCRKEF